MDCEVKKLTGLIDEISTFFLKNDSNEMDIKIKKESNLSKVFLTIYNTKFSDEYIDDLRDILNIPRQCEVEGFYWELMGDDASGDELFLIGSMIDSAIVEKRENNLYIEIERKN